MNIKPLGKNILVKMSGLKETTKGGIVIPNAQKTSDSIGKVLAVGPEVNEMIKVGCHIVLDSKYAQECKMAGEDCILIKEERCFVVVEDPFEDD